MPETSGYLVMFICHPCTPSTPPTEPILEYLPSVAAVSGQRTFWRPTVKKPTTAHITAMMKQREIFSLQACLFSLSFRPTTDSSKNEGAQKVTMREKMRHASRPCCGTEVIPEPGGICAPWGLMSGTGATLLSGRVNVFARRTVPEGLRTRGVGMGTSEESYLPLGAILLYKKKKDGALAAT